MKTVNCCNCGVEFGLSDEVYNARKIDGKSFTCPNGHSQYFSDSLRSQMDAMEKKLSKAEQDLKVWKQYSNDLCGRIDDLRAELTLAKQRIGGYKNALVRAKRAAQEEK